MSDSNEPTFPEQTEEPTAPKKNKGGRPRKVTPVDLEALIHAQAKQIANLQSALLEQGARQIERQEATLAPIPAASEDLPPGSYIKLGIDASGAPIMGKVRWTKPLIDSTYPAVTFTPMRDFTCGPHGVIYRVEPGKETTVPSIVKDLYDGAILEEKKMEAAYKPWSATERAELDARAAETPGVGQRSRLARVGAGLNVHAVEQQTPEPTAQ